MESEASEFAIGGAMAAFGLVGLILASGSVDSGIYVFGLSLFGFSLLFNLGLIRTHYDRQDASRAKTPARVSAQVSAPVGAQIGNGDV